MPPAALIALKRAHQATRLALAAQLRDKGMTVARFDVLKLLLRPDQKVLLSSEGLDQRAIQADLGVTSATLTRLLAGMEGRGLVSRAPNPHDSRGKRVHATAKARKLFAKIIDEGEAAFHARVFQGFSKQETLVLTRQLVLDPALEGTSGKYFEGTREIRSSAESYDQGRTRQLWKDSLALTGLRDALA